MHIERYRRFMIIGTDEWGVYRDKGSNEYGQIFIGNDVQGCKKFIDRLVSTDITAGQYRIKYIPALTTLILSKIGIQEQILANFYSVDAALANLDKIKEEQGK